MLNAKEASIAYLDIGTAKAQKSALTLLLLGMLAGAYIALGSAITSLGSHAVENPGVARALSAAFFPVGLCMVLFTGAELFTGNALMGIALLDKRIRFGAMLRNWCLVYLGNLLGSLLIVFLIVYSNQLNFNSNHLAAYTIKVATAKSSLPFHAAVLSGILCNILVCVGVFMGSQSKGPVGKILGAYLPVSIFVLGAFEHVVANMYYLFAGLVANSIPAYAQAAIDAGYDATQLTLGNAILHNFLPVTIGNIIGGFSIAALLWFINVRSSAAKSVPAAAKGASVNASQT